MPNFVNYLQPHNSSAYYDCWSQTSCPETLVVKILSTDPESNIAEVDSDNKHLNTIKQAKFTQSVWVI